MPKISTSESDLLKMEMDLESSKARRLIEKDSKTPLGGRDREFLSLLVDCILPSLRHKWNLAREQEKKYAPNWDRFNATAVAEKSGFQVTAAADRAVARLFGPIGSQYGGISAEDFVKQLDSVPSDRDLELHVSSDGGDFSSGLVMYNALRARKGRTYAIMGGITASAATIVAMGATTRAMAPESWFMIHQVAMSGFAGKADDYRHAAETMDRMNEQLVRIYSENWSGTEAELRSALAAETWMTPDEAIASGLVDHIADQAFPVAARINPQFDYRHVPAQLSISASAADSRIVQRAKSLLAMHESETSF